MNTPNERATGENRPTLFPRTENPESGWVLEFDLLTRIAQEATDAGWAIGAEEVELVLLAAERFLTDTPLPAVPAAGRDIEALQAALRKVASWCENPTNRTMHTLRQQCSMLDALRDLAVKALNSVPEVPCTTAPRETGQLGDTEFRALLDLVMCSDPWPIPDGEAQRQVLEQLLNQTARSRSYTHWTEAYHDFAVPAEGGA